jgi:HAD superfamily hydrolase (TIGR01662 family)
MPDGDAQACHELLVAERGPATAPGRLARPVALLFDMGGVLEPSAEAYSAEHFARSFPQGLPEGAPVPWFCEMSQACLAQFLELPPPRPAIDSRPVIAEWLPKAGIEATADNIERWHGVVARWEATPIFPWAPPALAALKEQGFRMGVVSNVMIANRATMRPHFEAAGIWHFFEAAVFSTDAGINKPSPVIFEAALTAMDLDPGEAWYVGDKPQRDILGAHRVGLTAVLVESAHIERVDDSPEHWPDAYIESLAALPGLMARL